MSGEDLPIIALLSKPLIYAWVYEFLRRGLPLRDRGSGWRSAGAGVARAAAGLAFGVPAAILLLPMGTAVAFLGFALVRAALWAGIAGFAFSRLPVHRGLLFGLGGAALNTILDLAVYGTPLPSLRLSC